VLKSDAERRAEVRLRNVRGDRELPPVEGMNQTENTPNTQPPSPVEP
jgi:hypothetical protein